jgi:demethylmenaquinone methyltransferase / 2-methoxy-6-polyprenyl-1,4-benzoquinol methylase
MSDTPDANLDVEDTRRDAWRMFDRIAHRYDLLNHLLSFGTDCYWRARVARQLRDLDVRRFADIATGTADQLLALCHRCPELECAIGIDMSAKMLEFGQEKVVSDRTKAPLLLVHGDALHLPLRDNTVDAVTISFGIRNVVDVVGGLREMHRVLVPGGRAIVLEFSLPSWALFRNLYLFYFRHILPKIGGLISGDSHAYSYLNQTVETFPYGDAFCDLMREAGFATVSAKPLTFGIATMYCGDKAPL